ncbi:MAG: pilus assembly protein PilP [Candidatus Binatia bacterium]
MSRRARGERRDSLLLILIFIFFNLHVALASQDVVYKDSRPLKKISETTKERGEQRVVGKEEKKGSYSYDPTGKTDPFKSFIALQEEMEEKKRSKPKTYLETIDLSQLELSVVIRSPKGNWAMVRDSKGLGHVIKIGTAIGTDGGVVYQITEKEVIIREEYRDFRGNMKHKDVSKRLPSFLE